jgi:hypothetical protein
MIEHIEVIICIFIFGFLAFTLYFFYKRASKKPVNPELLKLKLTNFGFSMVDVTKNYAYTNEIVNATRFAKDNIEILFFNLYSDRISFLKEELKKENHPMAILDIDIIVSKPQPGNRSSSLVGNDRYLRWQKIDRTLLLIRCPLSEKENSNKLLKEIGYY